MNVFKLKGMSAGYGNIPILHALSLEIGEGEFFGIIGPNGSGKTTLLKALTRIIRPYSGEIIYRGKDISKKALKELACEVAFVGQDALCSFSFTVFEIVMMGRFPHLKRFRTESKRDYDITNQALETVNCISLKDKYIDQISAGERQRVIIARALAQEPRVLILDEPTSRLDIGHQIEIFDLIKKLNLERKITVSSVLHDLNLASDYCDRILLMNEGKIFKIGEPGKILTYENLEKIYKTIVVVNESPATKRPHITLVPKYK